MRVYVEGAHLQEANPHSLTAAVPFEPLGWGTTALSSRPAHGTFAIIHHFHLLTFFPNTNALLKFCTLVRLALWIPAVSEGEKKSTAAWVASKTLRLLL